MTAPALRDVQEFFWKLLVAPEGVEKGIAALEAEGEPAGARVDAWIEGDERLDARGRLDVYANMYFFRIRDAAAEDFPALANLLGPGRWHDLMTDYLLVHPSRHWSLRWVGRELAAFLETHPLASGRPDLPDLARLEWAIVDAFQQFDAPPLAREELAAVPPGRWPELRFAPAPSVRLLELGWDVAPVREALAELPEGAEPAPPPPAARAHTLLVWRAADLDTRYDEPASPSALRALLSGEPFEAVCGRMAEESGDAEGAAAASAALLADALGRGLLSGFTS